MFEVFIENAIAGKPLVLWGDIQKGRDIIYVKDVVSAIIAIINHDSVTGLYNIASGRQLSLIEQAEATINVFSPKENPSKIICHKDKANNIRPFLYDISKARKDFNWFPKYSLEQMLVDYRSEMMSRKFDFLLDKNKEFEQAQ